MKKLAVLAVVTGSILTFTASAYAGPARRREARQAARIHQGVESGSLTPGEAKVLRYEQRAAEHARRKVLSDGQVTPREARLLNAAQSRASRHIYRLKHNDREVE